MSAKIYFNQGKSQRLQRLLLATASSIHRAIAPDHALRTARRLLLKPSRISARHQPPAGLVRTHIETRQGALACYQLGQGPRVLLVHGWSGAAHQYYPLMQALAEQGFTALAYDQPAHGDSPGSQTHLPAFEQAFDDIIASQSDVIAVVAHSMGAAGVLQSKHYGHRCPLVLIAPVLNYVENTYQTVARSGYSMALFEQVIRQIEHEYAAPMADIDPVSRLSDRPGETCIIHDPNDRLAKFAISQQVAKQSPRVSLHQAPNLGHGRIMASDLVRQLTLAQLTKTNDQQAVSS